MTSDFEDKRLRRDVVRRILEGAVVVVFALLVWNNYTLRRHSLAAAANVTRQRAFVPKDFMKTLPTIDLQGVHGSWDFQTGRFVVAIIDPRCPSCESMIQTLRGQSDIRILSLAPLKETLELVESPGLAGATRMLGSPVPMALDPQLHMYPQLLIVDHGMVVRTCASIAECR